MTSPYSNLPSEAFWRSAVTDRAALDPGNLFSPRFPVTRAMKVVTAGSCFAQHVGRTLRQAGFNVQDAEPAPGQVSDAVANQYGYRLYSARYGNIYTVRQLVQLLDEAEGVSAPALPVWEKDGRFHDAQRPGVEPDGLDDAALVAAHRARHLTAVRDVFYSADLFVFTLGLTEAWVHTQTSTVYPTAPGTIAGSFDPAQFSFKNYGFREIFADFAAFRKRMMERNPKMKFLITVSPVPLTATASGNHVEVATCYSKSVLRAVCGSLYEQFRNVDYFPSYEIITSTNNRGVYFEPNKRSVSAQGVDKAMSLFLMAQGAAPAPGAAEVRRRAGGGAGPRAKRGKSTAEADADVVCEEALLDAFGR